MITYNNSVWQCSIGEVMNDASMTGEAKTGHCVKENASSQNAIDTLDTDHGDLPEKPQSFDSLESNMDQEDLDLTDQQLQQLRSTKTGLFCFICGYQTNRRNRNYLRKHLIVKHGVNYKEYQTAVGFDDTKIALRLLGRLKSKHGQKPKDKLEPSVAKEMSCADCSQSFGDGRSLVKHVRQCHLGIYTQTEKKALTKKLKDARLEGGDGIHGKRKRKENIRGTNKQSQCQVQDACVDDEWNGISSSRAVKKADTEASTNSDCSGETKFIPHVSEKEESAPGTEAHGLHAKESNSTSDKKKITGPNSSVTNNSEIDDLKNDLPDVGVCLLCGQKRSRLWNMLRHARVVHHCSPGTYKSLLQLKSEDRASLVATILKHQNEKQAEVNETRCDMKRMVGDFTGLIVCPVCKREYRDPRSAICHVRKQHKHLANFHDILLEVDNKCHKPRSVSDSSHKCPYCDVERGSKSILPHLRLCHTDRNDLREVIEQLNKEMDEQSLIKKRVNENRKHRERHQNGIPWKCKFCQKAFSHRRSATRHQSMCELNPNPVQKFVCTVCSKTFDSKELMLEHKATHGAKNFLCDVCGKAYKNRSGVVTHKRSVHAMATKYAISYHQCEHCDQKFYAKSKWKKHMLSHTGKLGWGLP